jgi:hypothetical protein
MAAKESIRIGWPTWIGLFFAAMAPALTLGIFLHNTSSANLQQSVQNEMAIAAAIKEVGSLKAEMIGVRLELRELVRHEERFSAMEKRIERLEKFPP